MPKLAPEIQELRKKNILESALTCFVKKGYHQTSIDQIAEEAKLSKGSIYTYFDSKKTLYLELLQFMISETGLIENLSQIKPNSNDALKKAMQGMLAFTTSKNYSLYTSLIIDAWTQSRLDSDIRQAVAKNYASLRKLFTNTIKNCIESGEFNQTDPEIIASIFIATFDGLMVQAMLENSAIDWQKSGIAIQETWRRGLENFPKEN